MCGTYAALSSVIRRPSANLIINQILTLLIAQCHFYSVGMYVPVSIYFAKALRAFLDATRASGPFFFPS